MLHVAERCRSLWVLCALACLLPIGCGGPTTTERPWFCDHQGTDPDETLRVLRRRMRDRTAGAAVRVLKSDEMGSCWGNAALIVGALGHDGTPILSRVDAVATSTHGSALQADPLLIGLGLTVRESDDAARIAQVVEALVLRGDPHWWADRIDTSVDTSPGHRQTMELRARSALLGLAWSGTRAAETALETIRSAPRGDGRFDPPPAELVGDLIRRNRQWRGQPPGMGGR